MSKFQFTHLIESAHLARDVARLTRIVESYAANPSLGNYDEVWEV